MQRKFDKTTLAQLRRYCSFALGIYSAQLALMLLAVFVHFVVSCVEVGSDPSAWPVDGLHPHLLFWAGVLLWLISGLVGWQFLLAVGSYRFVNNLPLLEQSK